MFVAGSLPNNMKVNPDHKQKYIVSLVVCLGTVPPAQLNSIQLYYPTFWKMSRELKSMTIGEMSSCGNVEDKLLVCVWTNC